MTDPELQALGVTAARMSFGMRPSTDLELLVLEVADVARALGVTALYVSDVIDALVPTLDEYRRLGVADPGPVHAASCKVVRAAATELARAGALRIGPPSP